MVCVCVYLFIYVLLTNYLASILTILIIVLKVKWSYLFPLNIKILNNLPFCLSHEEDRPSERAGGGDAPLRVPQSGPNGILHGEA